MTGAVVVDNRLVGREVVVRIDRGLSVRKARVESGVAPVSGPCPLQVRDRRNSAKAPHYSAL